MSSIGLDVNYRRSSCKTSACSDESSSASAGPRVRHKSGNESYADLITRAILSVNEKRMSLAQIYDWLATNVPGLQEQRYLHSSKGWKNAVRHTLSINSRFRKITRTGRSAWWTLDQDCIRRKPRTTPCSPVRQKPAGSLDREDFELESFRPRRGTEPAHFLLKCFKDEICSSTPASPYENKAFDLNYTGQQYVQVRDDKGALTTITVPNPLNLKTKIKTEAATQTEDDCPQSAYFSVCPSQSFDFESSPQYSTETDDDYRIRSNSETNFRFPALPNDLRDISVDPFLKCDIFQVLRDDQTSWV